MQNKNLFNSTVLVLTVFFSCTSDAGVPTAGITVLEADFNSQVPGSMIGEGGAAQEEPVDLSDLTGEVIEDIPGENFLRIENNSGDTNGRNLRWDFLNEGEYTEGEVVFSFQLTPLALERYSFGVRESGGSSRFFLGVTYSSGGTISANDAAGAITLADNTYAVGVSQNIRITFDMDAGTSEMMINGNVIFTGREHGIVDRGVGRLLTGYSSSNTAEPFNLDNISVIASVELPLVLDVDLEDKTLGDSLDTGGAALSEPVTISNGLVTEIIDSGMGNQALSVMNPSSGSARAIRWEFLNNAAAKEGKVAIEADLTFDQLDNYQFLVREASGSGSSFTNTRFFSGGNITISDSNGSAGTIIPTYQAGQLYRLRFTFDMDQGTYTAWLNDDVLVEDRAHGVNKSIGLGSIITAFQSNSSGNTSFVLDDLQVGVSEPNFELIFRNSFE